MEERFNEFMDNHWPHMQARVGRIEGAIWLMAGTMMAVGGLLGALVMLVAKAV
jgi:hypothetical protein